MSELASEIANSNHVFIEFEVHTNMYAKFAHADLRIKNTDYILTAHVCRTGKQRHKKYSEFNSIRDTLICVLHFNELTVLLRWQSSG